MKVLILGNGGREHALCWKILQSQLCTKLFCAPGNAGTASLAHNIDVNPTDIPSVIAFCQKENIDLVIVGPEAPLAAGVIDALRTAKITAFGPTQNAARLETSKAYAKAFMARNAIPTAPFAIFGSFEDALQYSQNATYPIVVKADGLAAGKGVIICNSLAETQTALQAIFIEKKFGNAGNQVVIECFLKGREVSVFALTDGKHYKLLPSARDYKRIGKGDTGANTGGMGAISPVPYCDAAFLKKVEEHILQPTLAAMADEGNPFTGFLFMGLMEVDGNPYVIEYNVRLGDPETQTILPLIESDFLAMINSAIEGKLDEYQLTIKQMHSVTIVCASGGYPESFTVHHPISLPQTDENCNIFHAGTIFHANNNTVLTNGGRVLAVNATAPTLQQAQRDALECVKKIDYEKKYFREDIGLIF